MQSVEPIVEGVPLVVLILGLVEFAKRFGLSGNLSTALSMALGVVFGVLFQVSLSVPDTLAGWLAVIVYGLALGLTASGLYDWSSRRFPAAPVR